jgi:lipopolysaccharide export LptBFGC system permease protein LptF
MDKKNQRTRSVLKVLIFLICLIFVVALSIIGLKGCFKTADEQARQVKANIKQFDQKLRQEQGYSEKYLDNSNDVSGVSNENDNKGVK